MPQIYDIRIEFLPGTNINSAISEAIRISKLLKRDVRFKFNDVEIPVDEFKNPSELYRYYHENLGK